MPINAIQTRLAAVPEITASTRRDATGAELDVVCQLAMDAARVLCDEAQALGGRVNALEQAPPPSGASIYYRADDLEAVAGDDAIRLAAAPYSGAVQVFKDGLLLRAVQAALTGQNVSLSTPAVGGEIYSVLYWTATENPGASMMIRAVSLSGTLPAANRGEAYSAGLTAANGVPPYAWSISSGALPGGLAIDAATGVISGTPTVAGSFGFTVRVQSSLGDFAESAQTVSVAAGATWDAANKTNTAVLTNSDKRITATAGGTYANARSSAALTGKIYFELVVGQSGTSEVAAAGVADATWQATNTGRWAGISDGSIPGSSIGSWRNTIYRQGSSIGANSAGHGTSPARIGFAVDTVTREVWIRINGAAWRGGGDPAAGTLPTTTVGGTGGIFAIASLTTAGADSNRYVDLLSAADELTDPVPAGFTAGIPAPP